MKLEEPRIVSLGLVSLDLIDLTWPFLPCIVHYLCPIYWSLLQKSFVTPICLCLLILIQIELTQWFLMSLNHQLGCPMAYFHLHNFAITRNYLCSRELLSAPQVGVQDRLLLLNSHDFWIYQYQWKSALKRLSPLEYLSLIHYFMPFL